MSKRLEDEALAYFDECVSLSTFDSSDFSSPEDPPVDLATPVNYSATLLQASLGTSATTYAKSSFNTKQVNLLTNWCFFSSFHLKSLCLHMSVKK
jgi:hypothetical protein